MDPAFTREPHQIGNFPAEVIHFNYKVNDWKWITLVKVNKLFILTQSE